MDWLQNAFNDARNFIKQLFTPAAPAPTSTSDRLRDPGTAAYHPPAPTPQALAPTSTSDRLRDTGTAAYPAARTPVPTSTADVLRDTGSAAYTDVAVPQMPLSRPQLTRTQELEQASRASEGEGLTNVVQFFGSPQVQTNMREALNYQYATLNGLDYSIADAVKNLDNASMKLFTNMLIANEGDVAKTIEQFFGSWYREDVSEAEAMLIQQIVWSAHEAYVRQLPPPVRRGDVRVSLSDHVRSATTPKSAQASSIGQHHKAQFDHWQRRGQAGWAGDRASAQSMRSSQDRVSGRTARNARDSMIQDTGDNADKEGKSIGTNPLGVLQETWLQGLFTGIIGPGADLADAAADFTLPAGQTSAWGLTIGLPLTVLSLLSDLGEANIAYKQGNTSYGNFITARTLTTTLLSLTAVAATTAPVGMLLTVPAFFISNIDPRKSLYLIEDPDHHGHYIFNPQFYLHLGMQFDPREVEKYSGGYETGYQYSQFDQTKWEEGGGLNWIYQSYTEPFAQTQETNPALGILTTLYTIGQESPGKYTKDDENIKVLLDYMSLYGLNLPPEIVASMLEGKLPQPWELTGITPFQGSPPSLYAQSILLPATIPNTGATLYQEIHTNPTAVVAEWVQIGSSEGPPIQGDYYKDLYGYSSQVNIGGAMLIGHLLITPRTDAFSSEDGFSNEVETTIRILRNEYNFTLDVPGEHALRSTLSLTGKYSEEEVDEIVSHIKNGH